MSDFLTVLTQAAHPAYPNISLFAQYVRTGSESDFRKLTKRTQRYEYYGLWNVWHSLPPWNQFTDEAHRFLRAAVVAGLIEDLMRLFTERHKASPHDDEAALAVFLPAFGASPDARAMAAAWIMSAYEWSPTDADAAPNAWGRFLLSLTDAELSAAGEQARESPSAFRMFLKRIPERIPAIAGSYLRVGVEEYRLLCPENCGELLALDAGRYERMIFEAVAKERRPERQSTILRRLFEYFPDKYEVALRTKVFQCLEVPGDKAIQSDVDGALEWLFTRYGPAVVDELRTHFRRYQSRYLEKHLELAVKRLGPAAAPFAVAATEHEDEYARMIGIRSLTALELPEFRPTLCAAVEKGMTTSEYQKEHYIRMAEGFPETDPVLWKLLEHKSKPIRVAAALQLAKRGEAALDRAVPLLRAKKAATRGTAVTLIARVGTTAAEEALAGRVDEETDEEVRDQILLALDKVWERQGRRLGRAEVDERIKRAAAKPADAVPAWLDEANLPPLFYADGGDRLSGEAVRYLLYRQSRARAMAPDIEAKPLLALVDRKRSGEFALAVLRGFLAGAKTAEDRWAMALAGLLGDDRIVGPLMRQIREWIDSNRGKMAEYAVQALALAGTDAALSAVDALSIRYRSKQKNVGKAAADAFAEAADRIGLTVDELGDRVVPWLGFEPGKPRVIESGDKRIEIRIGPDFKLEYRDPVKGKKSTSPPAWVPADVKSELKDRGATLREVVKGQLARVENLLVRQFRWPVARWRELYPVHPLLIPFAVRLLWAWYDEAGRRQVVFRALEDGSLTGERDEAVTLPENGTVGLVHPLELSADERRSWASHLADYDISSPVLQLERPVLSVKPEEAATRMSDRYDQTELNAVTFKGRVERLGWRRGSVGDGGGISFYLKTFPGANVDVILPVEGMYVGIGMESSITLGKFCFVRGGTVDSSGYSYDEPRDENDPRLIPFGEVPPIVFSETLGDLAKIAGAEAAANLEE